MILIRPVSEKFPDLDDFIGTCSLTWFEHIITVKKNRVTMRFNKIYYIKIMLNVNI